MQTNLHVAVASEAEAMAAIGLAFKQGVRDVVTFDYWSHQINERKEQARQRAIVAAKKKAETLLAIFDERPKVINVQERTDGTALLPITGRIPRRKIELPGGPRLRYQRPAHGDGGGREDHER